MTIVILVVANNVTHLNTQLLLHLCHNTCSSRLCIYLCNHCLRHKMSDSILCTSTVMTLKLRKRSQKMLPWKQSVMGSIENQWIQIKIIDLNQDITFNMKEIQHHLHHVETIISLVAHTGADVMGDFFRQIWLTCIIWTWASLEVVSGILTMRCTNESNFMNNLKL